MKYCTNKLYIFFFQIFIGSLWMCMASRSQSPVEISCSFCCLGPTCERLQTPCESPGWAPQGSPIPWSTGSAFGLQENWNRSEDDPLATLTPQAVSSPGMICPWAAGTPGAGGATQAGPAGVPGTARVAPSTPVRGRPASNLPKGHTPRAGPGVPAPRTCPCSHKSPCESLSRFLRHQ